MLGETYVLGLGFHAIHCHPRHVLGSNNTPKVFTWKGVLGALGLGKQLRNGTNDSTESSRTYLVKGNVQLPATSASADARRFLRGGSPEPVSPFLMRAGMSSGQVKELVGDWRLASRFDVPDLAPARGRRHAEIVHPFRAKEVIWIAKRQ